MSITYEQLDTALKHIYNSNFESLYTAVSNRDLVSATNILEGPINVNQVNPNTGLTVVHVACINKDTDMVDLLLKYKTDVNIKIFKRELKLNDLEMVSEITKFIEKTPLYITVYNSDIATVNLLLNYGVNINIEPTILITAVRRSCKEIIRTLLEHGANPNYLNESGATSLIHCIAEDFDLDDIHAKPSLSELLEYDASKVEIVKLLLQKGADPHAGAIKNGLVPLHIAAKRGYLNIAKTLLKFNANIHYLDSQGNTPLHFAVFNSYPEIIDLLLEYNANINASNSDNRTPLHEAVSIRRQNYDIVEKLLRRNANVNVVDKNGCVPLHFANNIRIVNLLLHHNADVHAKTRKGQTPLHTCLIVACSRPSMTIKMIEAYLERNIDINAVDNRRRTPLAIACEKEIYDIIKFLLAKGADANLKDLEGRTPLMIICFRANDSKLRIVTAFLEHGAEINYRDIKGTTALHMAAYQGSSQIFKLLLKHGADIDSNYLNYKNLLEYIEVPLLSLCRTLNAHLIRDSLSEDEQRQFQTYLHNFYGYLQVYEIARYHMIKLKCCGLRAYNNNLDFCNTNCNIQRIINILINRYQFHGIRSLRRIEAQCNAELQNLQLIRFGRVTLHDLLRDNINNVANYVHNQQIVQALKSNNFDNRFPLYANIIKNRFSDAANINEMEIIEI